MAFLREIQIEGLFGLYDHSVELRRDPPVTFVAGPNGVGKTTLLRLTHALLSGSYRELPKHQFSRLSVASERASLVAEPASIDNADEAAPGRNYKLLLRFRRAGLQTQEETLDLFGPRELAIPPWIHQIGPELWQDTRNDRLLDSEDLESYLLTPVRRRRLRRTEPPDWFDPNEWLTDFIETKRLDALIMRERFKPRHGRDQDPDETRPPIDYYLDAVQAAMRDARIASGRISQLRDRSFARRMLEGGGPRFVNEADLRNHYSDAEQIAGELAANALLAESLDFLPAGKLPPTEKRVMRLFLDDFEAKVEPLTPISAKLNKLKEIVDSKFLNKHMDIDVERGPIFVTEPDGELLDADALSSGEQHEIALVSRLLFSVRPNTTVLIDEPELSLHVSWQHRMLKDLSEIGDLVGLAFLLATHSTATINGRWDLVEELGPLDEDAEPT